MSTALDALQAVQRLIDLDVALEVALDPEYGNANVNTAQARFWRHDDKVMFIGALPATLAGESAKAELEAIRLDAQQRVHEVMRREHARQRAALLEEARKEASGLLRSLE